MSYCAMIMVGLLGLFAVGNFFLTKSDVTGIG